MSGRDSAAWRSRAALTKVGATLVGLLAVTVAFVASSSAKTVNTHHSATAASGTKLTGKQCAEDKAAGTINYVSPFSYSASAGVIDVVEAQKSATSKTCA